MTVDVARSLLNSSDLVGIGLQADAVRKRLHPERVVSYGLHDGPDDAPESRAVLEVAAHSTAAQWSELIERVRDEQEATGRFVSFTVVPVGVREVTAAEYMKFFAVARIWLENIPHAEIPVARTDTKLAQVALRFGANDLGGIPLEREEDVRWLIRDAGFTPKRRDAGFRSYFLR